MSYLLENAFKELRRIDEAKEDQQRLIDFAGEKLAKLFMDNRKNYKSPENDIYYWLKKTPDELQSFIDSHKTKNQREKSEIEQICETPEANAVENLGEHAGYIIYKINTPEASVKYGLVVGGKAGWCISGGYYDGKNDGDSVLSEARKYFNGYLRILYKAYYFIIGHNTKYALCLRDPQDFTYDLWNQADEHIKSDIPGLSNKYLRGLLTDVVVDVAEKYVYDGREIFEDDKDIIREVTIPASEAKVRDEAFMQCPNLSQLTIAEGVEEIGKGAFAYCEKLSEVKLPQSVRHIDAWAFASDSTLGTLDMPAVQHIGKNAFCNCDNLEEVTIPSSAILVDASAFANCTNLHRLTFIKGDFVDLGVHAFSDCSSLRTISLHDHIIPHDGVFRSCNILDKVVLEPGFTNISPWMFAACINLPQIHIPGSVREIGEYAFFNCLSLSHVIIDEGVKRIGKGAFCHCSELEEITIPRSVVTIYEAAFEGCKNLKKFIATYDTCEFFKYSLPKDCVRIPLD